LATHAQAYSDGFVAAMAVVSALSLLGALCGAALPGRRAPARSPPEHCTCIAGGHAVRSARRCGGEEIDLSR